MALATQVPAAGAGCLAAFALIESPANALGTGLLFRHWPSTLGVRPGNGLLLGPSQAPPWSWGLAGRGCARWLSPTLAGALPGLVARSAHSNARYRHSWHRLYGRGISQCTARGEPIPPSDLVTERFMDVIFDVLDQFQVSA